MGKPRWATSVVRIVVLALVATRGAGAQFELRPKSAAFWTGAAVTIAATALLDERIRSTTLAHQSAPLTTLADVGNALGTGRNIIVGLGLTYVVARLTHHRETANDVLRVSAGYAVSNVIVSILKPVVGRHRPDSTNDAWRFRPFSSSGEWHSFPSSHAVHAFSIAAGAAIASQRSWVEALGYTGATVVAWSRVYDDEHWASDVAASAIIGVATAATTMKWLEHRYPPRVTPGPPR